MGAIRYALNVAADDRGSASFVGWAATGAGLGAVGTSFAGAAAPQVATNMGSNIQTAIDGTVGSVGA